MSNFVRIVSDERQTQSCCSSCACAVCATRRHKAFCGCFGTKFRIVLKLHNAELAKRLGLRPRPQWESLQRSPIPPSWSGRGLRPLPHPPPFPTLCHLRPPPLTLNPASAPDRDVTGWRPNLVLLRSAKASFSSGTDRNMPGDRCTVYGNTKATDPSVCFHRIPQDPIRRATWTEALKLRKETFGSRKRVCSRHFLNGDPRNTPSILLRKRLAFPIKRTQEQREL